MDFFPPKKQTEEYLKTVFVEKGLSEVVKLHKAQTSNEAKRELTQVQTYNCLINFIYPFLSHFRIEFYPVTNAGKIL